MTGIRPEATIESEVVYHGALINVRRDTVGLPGDRTGSREIVEHPAVVAMVAVDSAGDLLLVRQYRKAVERVLLEIPAGSMESGESAEEAVRREMLEETGYTPRRIEPLAMIYPSPGISDEVMRLFVVSELEGEGKPTETSDEIIVERVPASVARDMALKGEIEDAKSIVGITMLESASLHNEVQGGG